MGRGLGVCGTSLEMAKYLDVSISRWLQVINNEYHTSSKV